MGLSLDPTFFEVMGTCAAQTARVPSLLCHCNSEGTCIDVSEVALKFHSLKEGKAPRPNLLGKGRSKTADMFPWLALMRADEDLPGYGARAAYSTSPGAESDSPDPVTSASPSASS